MAKNDKQVYEPAIAKVCIQCTDYWTQTVGTFLAEPVLGDHKSISPVFPSLIGLYAWCKANGWEEMPYSSDFPTGRYSQVTPGAFEIDAVPRVATANLLSYGDTDNVRIEKDCCESDQLGSFQNGTLQGFGPHLAVTIQTHLGLPADMENCSQQEAVEYLQNLLSVASNAVGNTLVFDVQIGDNAAVEEKN